MGSRFSASTTPRAAAFSAASSAKVVTVSGVLKEYNAAPFPVSIILADCKPPAETMSPCFICNADSLSYDEPVQALQPEDAVLPGRLYFVLPDGMQRRPLSGAQMGALAVRASRALETAAGGSSGGRGGKCGRKKNKSRALKVSPLLVGLVVQKEGSLNGGCGADGQKMVVSPAKRQAPAQLNKLASAGQMRGPGAKGSRYSRTGRSFHSMLGTIEEDEN